MDTEHALQKWAAWADRSRVNELHSALYRVSEALADVFKALSQDINNTDKLPPDILEALSQISEDNAKDFDKYILLWGACFEVFLKREKLALEQEEGVKGDGQG